MWTIAELDLPCRRIDWGGAFGGNDDPAHLARNPAGTIPAVELPDGRTLWESQAIVRYLCAVHATGDMIPLDPFERAQAEAIMDWGQAFARAVSVVRAAYKNSAATFESCSAAISLLRLGVIT
jgi:glutathione S-transferase